MLGAVQRPNEKIVLSQRSYKLSSKKKKDNREIREVKTKRNKNLVSACVVDTGLSTPALQLLSNSSEYCSSQILSRDLSQTKDVKSWLFQELLSNISGEIYKDW